jgi:hypothetical protein
LIRRYCSTAITKDIGVAQSCNSEDITPGLSLLDLDIKILNVDESTHHYVELVWSYKMNIAHHI